MPLSPEDRFAIEDLYARYAFTFDAADGPGWAALFTPDGEFVRTGQPPVRGRKALAAFVVERQTENPGVTHHTTSVMVDGDGDTATGRAKVLAVRSTADVALRLRNIGIYEDEFMRTDEGWRFARRAFAGSVAAPFVDAAFVVEEADGGPAGEVELVHRYFAALNAEDWYAMRALWHPDGELVAVGARPRHGVEEAIGFFERAFRNWPGHEDVPVAIIGSGDRFTVEVRFTGRTPAGDTVSFDAVDVFTVAGGRIRRITSWYDSARLRDELAALETAAAAR